VSEAGPPRAAGYVYVTLAEDGRPGLSAADQHARIEELVANRGWELRAVAEDSGPTAGERVRLAELLEQAGDFDKLVVARIDRLGRMARRQHEAMERLQAGGVDLVGVEDGVEVAADAGPELLSMLALLAQWEPDRNPYAGMRPDEMRQRGFAPATVIDVGAGRGTRYLYLAFPDAHHVLLEPLSDFEPELRRQVAIRSGEYHLTAVGDETGTATINVNPACLLESSINTVPGAAPVAREVPITTLDALVAEHGWKPPFAIKIDTEGFEDKVIEGATETLGRTQMVIAEVSVGRRFEGGYTFAEFIASMSARGFELCDVLNVAKDGRGDVSYMDCVFRG
jgi:FkbM family methyltransferase